jgi:hypothetical protein
MRIGTFQITPCGMAWIIVSYFISFGMLEPRLQNKVSSATLPQVLTVVRR